MLLPYSIEFEEGIARFTADNKAKYKALFSPLPMPGVPELEGFVFDFSFGRDASDCQNPKRPGTDERVRITLERLVSAFFEQASYNIISYVCDPNDAKDKARLRLFDGWHIAHGATVEKRTFSLPTGAVSDDGVQGENVGGIIYLKSNTLA